MVKQVLNFQVVVTVLVQPEGVSKAGVLLDLIRSMIIR